MDENTKQDNPQPLDMSNGTAAQPSSEQTSAPAEVALEESKSVGPVVAAIIILIVLVVAAFWVWGSRSATPADLEAVNTNVTTTEPADEMLDGIDEGPVTEDVTDEGMQEELVGDPANIDLLKTIDEESDGLIEEDTAMLDALEADLTSSEDLEAGLTDIDASVNVAE
jgi:hypothetical protein